MGAIGVFCKRCCYMVEPLDLFPNGICLECHAAEHESDTPAELYRDIVNGFGGK
jgi:hypothetical protein